MTTELADVKAKLEGVFDSVEETPRDTFIARKKLGYGTRNENVSAMKRLLEEALPRAGIETCGSVSSKGAIVHWYVEFNLD